MKNIRTQTIAILWLVLAAIAFFPACTPENPDDDINPETPEEPVTPDNPDNPDDPDNPDTPGSEKLYAELLIPASDDEHKSALAFPGAEGGGMYTTGGRGGKIIRVTNLNDSGAGSLREAIETDGARTVVFDVAGIIDLKSPLRIRKGDLTIAGQTAPGDGICIRNRSTIVEADNVIIRFVRFRLGDQGTGAGDGEDAVWGRYHNDIILDHCSMSWSIDECASFYANENFTMQWCILAESLTNSIHDKGSHGYGGIWGGKNASFHHNLLADHQSRNPRFDHPEIYEDMTAPARRGNVDFRCNAIYNWGENSTYGGEGAWFNMVNNYYKPGKASKNRHYFIDSYGIYSGSKNDNATTNSAGKKVYDYGYPELYMSGNVHTGYSDISGDNSKGIYWHNGDETTKDGKIKSAPFVLEGPQGQTIITTTHSAADAFALICESGGCSVSRDAVDERICKDAVNGTVTYPDGGNGSTNGLIDTQSAVGGWPEYSSDTENESNDKTDKDGDGLPDWFETKFGLDSDDSSDARKKTIDLHDRYDNFEIYLHYLVRNVVYGQFSSVH